MHVSATALAAAFSGVLLGACGTTNDDPGRIVGEIVYSGGPVVQGPSQVPRPGTIVVTRQGREVRKVDVPDRGRARFSLRAGEYVVDAVSGDAQCQPRSVKLRAGVTTRIRVVCQVK